MIGQKKIKDGLTIDPFINVLLPLCVMSCIVIIELLYRVIISVYFNDLKIMRVHYCVFETNRNRNHRNNVLLFHGFELKFCFGSNTSRAM